MKVDKKEISLINSQITLYLTFGFKLNTVLTDDPMYGQQWIVSKVEKINDSKYLHTLDTWSAEPVDLFVLGRPVGEYEPHITGSYKEPTLEDYIDN